MKTIKSVFTYIGYLSISVFFGYISNLAGDEKDFIFNNSSSFLPMLLTLTVLNTTLTNLLINEMLKFKEKNDGVVDINPVIHSMRKNAFAELFMITLTYIYFIINPILIEYIPNYRHLFLIIGNSLLFFDFLYFILVIYDSISGWYKLVLKNN